QHAGAEAKAHRAGTAFEVAVWAILHVMVRHHEIGADQEAGPPRSTLRVLDAANGPFRASHRLPPAVRIAEYLRVADNDLLQIVDAHNRVGDSLQGQVGIVAGSKSFEQILDAVP